MDEDERKDITRYLLSKDDRICIQSELNDDFAICDSFLKTPYGHQDINSSSCYKLICDLFPDIYKPPTSNMIEYSVYLKMWNFQ